MIGFIDNIISWIVLPFIVIYGYYFNNEPFVYVTIFVLWISFFLKLIVIIIFSIALGSGSNYLEVELGKYTEKKLEKVIKNTKKVKSKWYSFKMGIYFLIYIGLSFLIAFTGSVWTAIFFIFTFGFLTYIIYNFLKEITQKAKPIARKLLLEKQEKEMLDLVSNNEDN